MAVIAAILNGRGNCDVRSGFTRDTADSIATLYIAIYRQVPDGSAIQTAKQADGDVGQIDIQTLNGMPLSVKGAGIGAIIAVVRILADGRPFHRICADEAGGGIIPVRVKCTVVENDVVRQYSARATVLRLAARTVDNIPEQL